MEHFASPGIIDFAADDQRIFMYYSWKAHVFIHLWNNVYNRWIKSNFPFRWHRTTSTTSGWKSSIFKRNSSAERRLKFVASGDDQMWRRRQQEAASEAQRTSLSTAKATSSTQRPQTCREAATKYYNYTANEEREHRLPTLQKAMGRSGNAYWVRQYNYLLPKFRWNDRQQQLHDLYNARQECLFNGLRTAYQPLHHEQHWVLQ